MQRFLKGAMLSTDEELMLEATQTLMDCANHIKQQNELISDLKEENQRLRDQVDKYRDRWNGTSDEY